VEKSYFNAPRAMPHRLELGAPSAPENFAALLDRKVEYSALEFDLPGFALRSSCLEARRLARRRLRRAT